jgi:hypothetical protein
MLYEFLYEYEFMFEDHNGIITNDNIKNYHNYLLSKYQITSNVGLLKFGVLINLEIKIYYRNIDETLLVFWLLLIASDYTIPSVTFSKFNKKVCFFKLKNISIECVIKLMQSFLYDKQQLKKKTSSSFFYLDDLNFLHNNNFLKDQCVIGHCQFSAIFKQNYLEYIFYDLGVSNVKLFFDVKFVKREDFKNSTFLIYKDIIQFMDYSNKLKENLTD